MDGKPASIEELNAKLDELEDRLRVLEEITGNHESRLEDLENLYADICQGC